MVPDIVTIEPGSIVFPSIITGLPIACAWIRDGDWIDKELTTASLLSDVGSMGTAESNVSKALEGSRAVGND